MRMKKIVLIFVLCLGLASPSFAQNNLEGMRFLTVTALMQYGQKLYDRGDFNEACAVFNRVLFYDAHQAQALQYLKDMGRASVPIPVSVTHSVLQPRVFQPMVSLQDNIVIAKSEQEPMIAVDVNDTESLKKAIEAQRHIIEKLRAQIVQMRANLAVLSAGK